MKTLSSNITIVALFLASSVIATDAFAKVTSVKHHFVQGQFEDHPTMEMKFNGGGWKWSNKGKVFKPRVKLFFKTDAGKVKKAYLSVDKTKQSLWSLPTGYKTKEYEKLATVPVGKAILGQHESLAKSVCRSTGGAKMVVKNLAINTTFYAIGTMGSSDFRSSRSPLQLRVVCRSKVPNGNNQAEDTSAFKFAVTKVRLYTVPARPSCRKPVKLVAELHSNRAGNAKFTLIRGDGEKQNVSVVMGRKSNGFQKKWSKSYIFNKSTHRKYMVTVNGSKKSTEWTPILVKCY